MKIIFICHPWSGNLESTDFNPFPELTRKICRFISKYSNDIPLSTGLYFNDFLHDDIDDERKLGIKSGHHLMKKCDIVYSYEMNGISNGMEEDLKFAKCLNLPIEHFNEYPWKI